MRRFTVRTLAGLLMASMACTGLAQSSPESVAASFWSWHAKTQPDGALTRQQLDQVRETLTKDFACLLGVAEQFMTHFAKLYPQEKPPFAEGDLFTSSMYERPTSGRWPTSSAAAPSSSEIRVRWCRTSMRP